MKLALAILGIAAIATTVHAQPRRFPTVRISKHEVTGSGLDKQVVRRSLDRHANKFQYCYEKHLLVEPTLAGTLKVAFEISSSGKPTNLGTLGVEGEVAVCTKRVFAYVDFPKPTRGQIVAVKFELLLKP